MITEKQLAKVADFDFSLINIEKTIKIEKTTSSNEIIITSIRIMKYFLIKYNFLSYFMLIFNVIQCICLRKFTFFLVVNQLEMMHLIITFSLMKFQFHLLQMIN